MHQISDGPHSVLGTVDGVSYSAALCCVILSNALMSLGLSAEGGVGLYALQGPSSSHNLFTRRLSPSVYSICSPVLADTSSNCP